MNTGDDIVIKTNLPPEQINEIGSMIFAKWLDFAMGRQILNGRRLMYPTGKYAASIQFRQLGEATVAILADPSIAPEASVLEYGHGSFDMKTKYQEGRSYPMHRARTVSNRANGGLRRVGSGPPGSTPRVWAEVRSRTATGFASFGPNSDPNSWIMPDMPAYSPMAALATIARDEIKKMGG